MEATAQQQVRSGFLPDRIIHLHPTRLCNLACLHCYSESGPTQRTALDPDVLRRALPLLRAEGYEQISISGGEPLMYAPLLGVIEFARGLGFRVTMITNGMFPHKRIAEAASRLDGVAISFDGPAETHNHLRGRSDAFERAAASLARLADEGRSVSAAVSVTREAIPGLPDLADHLVGLGAKAMQVRPVARAGRAQTLQGVTLLSPTDQMRLYLVVLALQEELASEAIVHCDLAPARGFWQQREAYASLLAACTEGCVGNSQDRRLADLVNPLVITETGAMKPIAFDFHTRFHVASLDGLSSAEVSDYKEHRVHEFQRLIGGAMGSTETMGGLVDWFDFCTRLSNRAPEDFVPVTLGARSRVSGSGVEK